KLNAPQPPPTCTLALRIADICAPVERLRPPWTVTPVASFRLARIDTALTALSNEPAQAGAPAHRAHTQHHHTHLANIGILREVRGEPAILRPEFRTAVHLLGTLGEQEIDQRIRDNAHNAPVTPLQA